MSESLRVPLSAIDIQRRPTNYVVAPTKEDVPVTLDKLIGISSPIEDKKYLFEDSTHYVVAEEIKENESNEHTFAFYYPVEAEIERLEKERAKGKTKNEVEDLVKNNLTKALEEFAGKVSLTKIPFAWENNTMISPGMSTPMSEMLRELAEKTDDKRLHADAEGFMAIEQAFAQGSNVAFLVSPPSLGEEGFGTYGFFNVFVKKNGKL